MSKALRDELANDPQERGYSSMSPATVAADLNEPRIEANRSSLSGDEMFQNTDPTEYAGLSDHHQALWVAFTSKASVDPFAANNEAFVVSLFGGSSTTVANLAAARTHTISRAEQLGLGRVRAGDIQRARRHNASQ